MIESQNLSRSGSSFTRIAATPGIAGRRLTMWCPGCDEAHTVSIESPESWSWNGDRDRTTVSPSILVSGVQWAEGHAFYNPRHLVGERERTVCHSFLRDGHWEFLRDSTHVLAGQRVPMVPWPESTALESATPEEGEHA